MRKIDVYTDGSFDKATGRCTGAYIAVEGSQIIYCGLVKLEKPEYKESWNVSAELMAALIAVMSSANTINNEDYELTIVHDYVGVSEYVNQVKPWKAKKAIPKLYAAGIGKFRQEHKGVRLGFRKVKGHSGDVYNEMADRLANCIVPSACEGKMLADVVL